MRKGCVEELAAKVSKVGILCMFLFSYRIRFCQDQVGRYIQEITYFSLWQGMQ